MIGPCIGERANERGKGGAGKSGVWKNSGEGVGKRGVSILVRTEGDILRAGIYCWEVGLIPKRAVGVYRKIHRERHSLSFAQGLKVIP